MYSESDIDGAVTAGAISRDAAAALIARHHALQRGEHLPQLHWRRTHARDRSRRTLRARRAAVMMIQ